MKIKYLISFLLLSIFLYSHAFCEKAKEVSPAPVKPSDSTQQRIGPPPMPDLIIVADKIELVGTHYINFASACRGECIIARIKFRIENRGNADVRERFKVSIMQQLPSPPGGEQEVLTDDPFINGLRRSGVGEFYANITWPIYFPLSMAGQKVKIRAVVDSLNNVRESDETLNVSRWLEIQLPERKK